MALEFSILCGLLNDIVIKLHQTIYMMKDILLNLKPILNLQDPRLAMMEWATIGNKFTILKLMHLHLKHLLVNFT